jgi:hypothetical protein
MNAYTDKRVCERLRYTATIEFSYFNKQRCYEAQTLNYCDEGICFKSEVSLQPPATVVIRVKNFHPYGACNGDCRGLRSVTLAEAKWCNEILNGTEHFYEIGVKYYQPEY